MLTRFQKSLPTIFCLLLVYVAFPVLAQGRTQRKPIQYPCTTRTGLYCEIYGRGDPILFLHGLGGSSYSWRYMVQPLSQHHRVILIDFLGEGKSPKPSGKHYSLRDEADLIDQFIVEHDLRRLTLVGNSYGGAVSLFLAVRFQERYDTRLAKLILIDPGAYPEPLPDFLILMRTPIIGWLAVHLLPAKLQIYIVLRKSYYDPANITDEQVDTYAAPLDETGGRDALLQMGKGAIPKDIDELIKEYPTITVPTLILWGEYDHVLPPFLGNRLAKAIHSSTLSHINFAGHIPQEEQPAAVICQIESFLGPHINCPPQQKKYGAMR